MKYILLFLLFSSCLAERHTSITATVVGKKELFGRSGWVVYEYLTADGTHMEFITKRQFPIGATHQVLPCQAKRIWK